MAEKFDFEAALKAVQSGPAGLQLRSVVSTVSSVEN